jgi:hypothetical protein
MRCFDPVWRLNLIAINLKNIHQIRNKLIQILYGKPFTQEFSSDSSVSGYEVPTNLSGFKVSGYCCACTKPRGFTIGFVDACVNGNKNPVLKRPSFVMNPKTLTWWIRNFWWIRKLWTPFDLCKRGPNRTNLSFWKTCSVLEYIL